LKFGAWSLELVIGSGSPSVCTLVSLGPFFPYVGYCKDPLMISNLCFFPSSFYDGFWDWALMALCLVLSTFALSSIAYFGCDPLKGTIVVPLLLFDFIRVFGLGF
jgi:hypothetical protein